MPQVPQYDRQVAAGAARTPMTQINPRLAEQGQALERAAGAVGAQLQQHGERQQRDLESARTMEFRRELDRWELDNLRDPENGALYRRGGDAIGVADSTSTAFDEYTETLRQGVTSAREQQILQQLVEQRRTSMQSALSTHEARQRRQYAEDEIKATLSQTTSNIAAYWNDSDRVEQELDWGSAAIIEQGRMSGTSPSVTNAALDEYRSQAQRARILYAMDDDPFAAKALMDEVDADLLPADKQAINKSLEPAIKQRTGENRGRQIFRDWGGDQARLSESMDELNRIADADERRAAKSMFGDLRQTEDRRQKEAYTGVLNEAWEVVLGGGHWSSIPQSVMSALDVSDRTALMRFKDTAAATDWNLFTDLSESYARDPQAFLERSPGTYLNNLAESERRTVLGWRREAQSDAADGSERAWITTRNSVVNETLRGLGVDISTGARTSQVAQAAEFRGAVARAHDVWQATNPGKKMTETEFRSLVNRMAVQVRLPGTGVFFDDSARVFQVGEGQPVRLDIDNVPVGDRRQIEEALRAYDIFPTDDLIVQTYMKQAGLKGE